MKKASKVLLAAAVTASAFLLVWPLLKPGRPVPGLPGFVAIANVDKGGHRNPYLDVWRRLDEMHVRWMSEETWSGACDIYVDAKKARRARLALVVDSFVRWYRLRML